MNVVYTVHFQKGTRIGARSMQMVHVPARDFHEAIGIARESVRDRRYLLNRVDHFDGDHIVVDYEPDAGIYGDDDEGDYETRAPEWSGFDSQEMDCGE